MIKKIISLLLAGALCMSSLAGCGRAEGTPQEKGVEDTAGAIETGDKAMGRYLEEEVALPEGLSAITDMVIMEDGTLRIAGVGEEAPVLARSADGGATWEAEELPPVVSSEETEGLSLFMILSPKGEICIKGSKYDEETSAMVNRFWLVQPDGAAKSLDIQAPTEGKENNAIWDMAFAEDGTLYVTDYSRTAYEIEKGSGSIVKTFSGEGASVAANVPAGNKQVLVTDAGIMLYDRVSGEKLPEDTVLSEQLKNTTAEAMAYSSDASPALFAAAKDGGIFFCDSSGIYFHEDNGSVCEQLLDGNLSSLASPGVSLLRMAVISDEQFLVAAGAAGTIKLYRYTYDAHVPAVPETQLNVYALEDNDYIRSMISEFQKEHADVYIHFQTGLTGEDGATKEDALRALNTDILAGKGPDVMVLDGISVENYIEKNMLLDLTVLVEEAEQEDGLFTQVARAYEADGEIYAVPGRFYVPLIAGDGESVAAGASLGQLAGRAETLKTQNPNMPVCPPIDAKLLLRELFWADSANWLEDGKKINRDKLREFLEASKRIYDTAEEPDETSGVRTARFEEAYGNGTDSFGGYTIGLPAKHEQIAIGNLGSVYNFATAMSAIRLAGENIELGLLGGGAKKSFIPDTVLGISRETKEEDVARAFVKTMLGSHTAAGADCFPVNKKAYEASCINPYDKDVMGGISIYSENGIELDLEIRWPSGEEVVLLTGLLESLDSACIRDDVILDLVLEQGEKYLNGEQDLETATDTIMQKIKLYQVE